MGAGVVTRHYPNAFRLSDQATTALLTERSQEVVRLREQLDALLRENERLRPAVTRLEDEVQRWIARGQRP